MRLNLNPLIKLCTAFKWHLSVHREDTRLNLRWIDNCSIDQIYGRPTAVALIM